MPSFVYPTNEELSLIAQSKMPRLTGDDPLFSFFPMISKDTASVSWEQKDNYVGLQQLRGLGGSPGRIARIGGKRYTYEPGYYGEFATVDEKELVERRRWGTFAEPVDISDLVLEVQDQLLQRRLDRIRYILWTLLTAGTFSIALPQGGTAHTDTYPIQTYSASDWSNSAAATPLVDFRAVKLLARGYSVDFGAQATAYVNQVTANRLLTNANAADLFGRRMQSGATYNSLADVNRILLENDLPQVQVYDEGYFTDAGVWTQYIADDRAIVVGKRPAGQPVGEYIMTRNANNDGMAPGPYQKIVDRGELQVPRLVEVHDGHNGGPAIYFPSAVCVVSC